MKKITSILLFLLCFCSVFVGAQTTLLSESFETDGNGTRYSTSVAEFSDGSSDFFTRTDGTNISSSYGVSGVDGSFYFAAQDIDGEGAAPTQTLSINSINITNYENLSFSILLAEDDSTDGDEDWDSADGFLIEYQIDGGGYQNLLAVEVTDTETDGINGFPSIDTDFNGTGDGTEITSTFDAFGSSIVGTGSTLDIRITFNLNAGDEDIAIDLIEITGNAVSSNTPPTITSATTVSIDENQFSVIDIEASDDEGDTEGAGLSYSFTTDGIGGVDNNLFDLDIISGVVTFITPADFENPTDDGGNNIYDIQVTVTDSGGLTNVQDIAITVNNVFEPNPIIISDDMVTLPENSSFVIDVETADEDNSEGNGLTYELSAINDFELFRIDEVTGEIFFLVPPDFESLTSNVFNIRVFVSDPQDNSDIQDFTITVTDVVDESGVPTIVTCPSNQSEALDENCEAFYSDYTSEAVVTDDLGAGNVTITQFPAVGSLVTQGTVIITATDSDGNATSCSLNISVQDNIPPTLSCPDDQNIAADANGEGVLGDYTSLATASDNCASNVLVTQDPAPGTTITSNTVVTITALEDTTGVSNPTTCTFTVFLDVAPPPSIIINEVDADTPGSDTAEFVELYDGGTGNTSLDGFVLVFFNGSDDASYLAVDLDGQSTDVDGYFVLGNPGVTNVDLTLDPGGSGAIQNGADAVALFQGDDTDFPTDTPVSTTNMIDAIVYDTNDGDDSGLLTGLGQITQYNEGETNSAEESNSRVPNGTGDFVAQAPTPGAVNIPPVDNGSLSINDVTISETVGTATFIVTFTGTASSSFTVDFATTDGTATNADDYTANSGTLTFNGVDGESQNITVDILDNSVIEADETFTVNLTNVSDTNISITDGEATGTITDDDATPGVTGISFESTNVTVNEGDGTATFNVVLTGNFQEPFTVDFTTQDATATAPDDYTTTLGTLSFNGNDGEVQSIIVPIIEDIDVESAEDFTVNLSNVSSALVAINTPTATGSITDNDTPIDTTRPTLVSVDPADNATGVAVDAVLTATFDEPVQWVPDGGRILINNVTTNSAHEIIPNGSPSVSFSGTSAIIMPSTDLLPDNEYEVIFDFNSLQDAVGNGIFGITDAWSFTTVSSPPVLALISEFQPNPDGTDPALVNVELSGTMGESFSGWLLSIEDDGDNGLVDRAAQVSGVFDANGILVVEIPDLENPSFTFVLTDNFTGTAGTTDIDGDDDGIVDDLSSFGTILDALGIVDDASEVTYSTQLGGQEFAFTGVEPELVFRDASVGDWYAVNDVISGTEVFDINANPIDPALFNTNPIITDTFGAINPTTQTIPTPILISEFQPNPDGGDPANVTFELSGPAGDSFSGWIVSIEGDPTTQGLVDRAAQVSGTFDTNGLLTVQIPDLENPSFTVVLTSNFTGTAGTTDIDTDNDGTLDDISTFGTIYDALGSPDDSNTTTLIYGVALGGQDFAFTGTEPELVFRDGSTGAWYAVNDVINGTEVFAINGNSVDPALFNTNPIVTDTFGAINPSLTLPPPNEIGIVATNAINPEGDSGTTPFTFTVTRSGDTSSATTVDYNVTSTEADATDFGGTLPSGRLEFLANETTMVLTINVSGDTNVEPDETFTVTLSSPELGETLNPVSAEGIIQDDDGIVALTLISAIQGSGASSPLVDNIVTIEGIVTGDFQDSDGDATRNLRGFYVQEEISDEDGNPDTSEGIFVFDASSSTNPPTVDVNVGDKVRVTGTVVEFNGETQLGSITSIVNTGTGTIAPTSVALPFTSTFSNSDGELVADLERYEGMLVGFDASLTVTEYFNYDRYGEIRLFNGNRPFQFTQNNAPDATGFSLQQDNLAKNTVVLDDGQTFQNPDPLPYPTSPFSDSNSFRGGDTVTNLEGVVRFSRGSGSNGDEIYRIMPTTAPTFTSVNARPNTPDNVGGTLKVASFNVLNYFTTLDDGSFMDNGQEPRGANNTTEFDRQTQKLVKALVDIDADILGLVEIENDFSTDGTFPAIANLVNEINLVVGGNTYDWVQPPTGATLGDDAIAVGFIYKTTTVNLVGNAAALTSATFLDPNSSGTNRNRTALAQTFEEISSGGIFTATVNHFKSKGRSSGTLPPADDDASDGEAFWGDTRAKAAQALVDWLNTDPTGSGDADFMILGDLNGYAEEPVITTLESNGFTDLAQANLTNPYSFVFDGQLGTLDYALVNGALNGQVTGITEWHVNADEPDALDYNTDFNPPALFNGSNPFRNSDHDPVIVGLALESAVIAGYDLQITEMWPGNDPGTNLTSDWFEIINSGTAAWVSGVDPDLYYDDDSQDPSAADLINGITDIQPGERVVVVVGDAGDIDLFRTIWEPAYDLTGIEIGYTDGSGLGQGGDGVTLFVGGPDAGSIVDFETFPDASSAGGASYDVELPAFSTVGNASNAGATFSINDEGQPAIASPGNQGPLAAMADLQITEMWFGNDPGDNLSADWFEIINNGSAAWVSGADPDLFYDDDSQDPSAADLINGIIDIQPGERVVVVIGNATDVTEFTALWSPDYNLNGIEIGYTDGSGLGAGGDGVTLWTGDPNSGGLLSDFESYPDASAFGGQSYDVELAAFSLAGNTSNAAATSTLNNEGQAAIASPGNQGPLNPAIKLQVTEMWPGQDGDDVTSDWFEIYNDGTQAWVSGVNPDLFYDDDSADPLSATLINGISDIEPGESVIVVIGEQGDADAFAPVWSADYDLSGIEIGYTDGSGLGGSDAVTLWLGDPTGSGLLQDSESYNDSGNFNGQSYDVVNADFSVAGAGVAAPGTNVAVATTALGGDLGDTPAVGSPGNQGPIGNNPNAPDITVDVANLTPYLSLSEQGPSSVSGVTSDPTDPAATIGIPIILSDSDNNIVSLTIDSSNSAVVDNTDIQLTPSFSQGTSNYVLTIAPSDVGFSTITLTVTDGDSNVDTYTINYAASQGLLFGGVDTYYHTGSSDGSTAIATGDFMWVGDDEDQTLRLYDCLNSGLPVSELNFNTDLGSSVEIDIEGSAQQGSTIYWNGSTETSARSVLFTTTISGSGETSSLTYGDKYTSLNSDLLDWDANNEHGLGVNFFGLSSGFELEGLTFGHTSSTAFIGFRDPTKDGLALLLPITNFTSLPGSSAGSATFGAPIQLDLGGRSIRSIECSDNGCLIIGGPTSTGPNDFRLYTWSGNPAEAPQLRAADLSALQTGGSFEGIVGLPDSPFTGSDGDALTVKLMSDLGATTIYNDGVENKDQRREWKKFRTDIITLGPVIDEPVDLPNIVINEILADPAADLAGDANGDGTRSASEDEFIEIVNLENTNIDIGGWSLSDDDGGNPFVFPDGTILVSNCTAVLFGGGTPTGEFGSGLLFTDDGTIGTGLANGGDLVELRDRDGNLVASYSYGSEGGNNQSLTRNPDSTGTEPLVEHSTVTGSGGALFSPGTKIDGSLFSGCDVVVLPDLQITEIWPGNEPGSNLTEDWFEITNVGDISYSGEFGELFFDDESQDPTAAGPINGISTIAPGEVVVVVDDATIDEFLAVWGPSYDLSGIQIGTYTGAGLSQGGDGVTLWIGDPTTVGTLVDFETYPDANANGGQSYDVELAEFSTIGNANNAGQTDAVNDEGQPAIGSPGNQGPIAQECLITIDTQPLGATVCEDESINLGVGASGTGTISYVWQFSDDNGVIWNDLPFGNGQDTYQDSASLSGEGLYRVIVTSDNGTPNDQNDNCSIMSDEVLITVPARPTVSFTALADLAIDTGIRQNLSGGTPAVGTETGDSATYSGPGVTDNGDGTYDFDPVAAGLGTHTIFYTYFTGSGCQRASSDQVEVLDSLCTEVTVSITFDDYPTETSWKLLGSSGGVLLSGGGYTDAYEFTTITESVCVEDGCYKFVIKDSYGDGICCGQYGDGSYSVTDGDGNVLASGGQFQASEATNFCLEDSCTDSDGDGVCDANDICDGGDDNIDADGDGIPDFCDPTPCPDADGDGVCDADDICEGGDDNVDTDGDGIPDFCDTTDPTCTEVTVNITFDDYPTETSWKLLGSSGGVLLSGGGYTDTYEFTTITESVCVEDGCYKFVIKDSYGDGICCGQYGDGSYSVTDGDGNVLASGGQFQASEATNFCLEDSCTDTDGDGVCDTDDICEGGDDNVDTDGDGIPDFCDPTPCPDADGDGVCDADDICEGGDDNVDTDGDGIPDFCDTTDPTCTEVTVSITFDDYPTETSWKLLGSSGGVLLSGGGYTDAYEFTTITESVCVEDGCYKFVIKDSYGDGICCGQYGDGSYSVTDGDGNVLASGGQFQASEATNFCLEDSCTDTDGDGVCDANDICDGGDDNIDADGDGIPDFCDPTPCPDADGDGVCDADDICEGGDDNVDTDGDGIPDFCDTTDPTCTEVTVSITFDDYPTETSWKLLGSSGGVLLSGGGYTDAYEFTTITESVCVEDGCYKFVIKDSYGDGICCGQYGDGSYSVTDGDGNVLASGGQFQASEATNFCLEDSCTDTDGDGVCDANDICDGGDDNIDADGDGIPDFCDPTPCPDADGDGVCDADDICEGGDDNVDTDGDGIPDFCDTTDPSCTEVTVSITFDDYPTETSWQLLDSSGGVLLSGSGYTDADDFTTITESVCVEEGCYDFVINDTYGDGICCGQYGDGSYSVTDADGNVLASGGQFQASEATNFCLGGGCTDSDGDGVCDADDICEGGDDNVDTDGDGIPDFCDTTDPSCTEVTVSITFDDYPTETSWQLLDSSGGVLLSGSGYTDADDFTTITESVCLEDGCFDFVINDTYGDGICCGQYGDGSYSVTDADGNVLASGGQFQASEATNFCLGQTSLTSRGTLVEQEDGTGNELVVYPNPADAWVLIEQSRPKNAEEPVEVNLFDISGRLVLSKQYDNSKAPIELNTTEFQDGVYTAIIKKPSGTLTKRILIRH